MQTISTTSVKDWGVAGEHRVPSSISEYCPHCGTHTSFNAPGRINLPNWDMRARCSACQKTVDFFVMGVHHRNEPDGCDEIAMHPSQKSRRSPIPGLGDLPEKFLKVYDDLLKVYGAEAWGPSAGQSRVLLEAIVKDLDPNGSGDLFARLGKLTDKDFAENLHNLAHVVRKCGNLFSHFEEDKEATEEVASAVLDLTEYLLQYMYTLPRRVDDLEKQIDALGT